MSSPCPAIPTTSVAKINGTISDLIMRRNICDNGSSLTAKVGNTIPMMIPSIAAITIHCVSEIRRRPRFALLVSSASVLFMLVHPTVPQRRVTVAVREVEHKAHCEPDDETNPGDAWQLRHEVEARHDGDQRRERNPRYTEGSRPVRIGATKHYHAGRHQYKGEQRPDVREVDHFGDIRERREHGHEDSRDDRAHVRRLVTRMNLREHRWKQPVA